MKPPIVTMYPRLTTLFICALYAIVDVQFWPKAPPLMAIPIIAAGVFTQRQLSLYFIGRQVKQARMIMASSPYAYMRHDLEVLCRKLTINSDSYSASSVNGEMTVEIDRWRSKPYDDSWDISTTRQKLDSVTPEGESLYVYDIRTFHLTPDSPAVGYGRTVVIKTDDQTQEEGETVLVEDAELAYMDECVHAMLKKAFRQVGCIVASK